MDGKTCSSIAEQSKEEDEVVDQEVPRHEDIVSDISYKERTIDTF